MTHENNSGKFSSGEVSQLEHEQTLFRAVFESSVESMGVLSPDGTVLDVNRTALNYLKLEGVEKESLIGMIFWETPWWSDSPSSQEKVKEAIKASARGDFVRYDALRVLFRGRELTFDFSVTPVFNKDGNVQFLVPEARDITERIQAERAVRDREARNRALLDSAPVGICTVTTSGIIESANSSLHKLLGYAREELNGKPVTCILEGLHAGETPVDDGFKTGERRLFGVARETTAMHKDGSKVPVELALSILNLGHSRVFIVIIRDITELRKSQQLQARLAAIVESSDDAIYASDMSAVITSWNPAAERLYGYTSAEVIGKSELGLVVPDDRARELAALLERIGNGESIGHFETVRKDRTGNLIDVDLTISPIRNPQGKVIGVSKIARDISMRKAAERRISEFYSMVSHELRTPLTSIRASLGLLEGGIAGSIDEEALQLVQIARAESDRLILLINDILDLQKIEAGMLELKLRRVHLSQLINTVAESLRAMADEHGVKLKASYSKDWTFFADRDRVIQVIHNLLSNAIKYSRKSDVVKITAEERSDNVLRISIVDRGPGIRADQMHKLFGKFQQLDSSDARPQGGTGLGLAISKAIVEQHGGTVGVKSVVGEGSTFWFEIPMSQEKVGTNSDPKISTARADLTLELPAAQSGSLQPPSVLIVEDDRSTLELLIKQFDRLGIKCIAATDGQTALGILRHVKPDLLILDLGLPAPDGFELVRILKKTDLSSLPLLVYTCKDLSENERCQLKLGPSMHITKSTTSQEEIIRSVKTLLGARLKDQESRHHEPYC